MPELDSSPPEAQGSTRERIDRVALSAFAAYGYDGVSMQTIADAVGWHKSSLFHHYKSKAEIADAVLTQAMARLLATVEPDLRREGPPSLDHFVAICESAVDYFAREPETAQVVFRVLLAPMSSPLRSGFDRPEHPFYRLLTLLVEWFVKARRTGAIRYVRIRHALFDVMGVLVFHPAAARQLPYLAGDDPFRDAERLKRRREVGEFIRRALAP